MCFICLASGFDIVTPSSIKYEHFILYVIDFEAIPSYISTALNSIKKFLHFALYKSISEVLHKIPPNP